MKIAITGATGKLGRLVVRQLLYRTPPHNIAVSVRRPEAARRLAEQGVAVRYGDYDDPGSLEKSFAGAQKLLLISSSHPDDTVRFRQHTAAIDAARRAGVAHIAYTSIAFAEKGRLPLHRLHLKTELAIRESGIPYTILRNAYYMDVIHFLRVREALASGVLLSPPGEWAFNTASREDLGEAAAAVLTEEGHGNRVYELTSPRTWNLDELARALSAASGRRVIHRSDPAAVNEIFKLLPCSDMKSVSPDLERLIGHSPRTVEEEVRLMIEPH
ncbi:SDR family oxidoreductase [Paenibacillus sp. MBLB4367]|uniref:SDR family oxidoreductase n=1 Tax=Paenibacillus sp. MBLB4367 TaxID=3384767 RepID=UPI00390813D0